MTITQILDQALPFTKEELRCGLKKKRKQEQRIKLATALYEYEQGKEINLSGFSIDKNILSNYLNRNQNVNYTR